MAASLLVLEMYKKMFSPFFMKKKVLNLGVLHHNENKAKDLQAYRVNRNGSSHIFEDFFSFLF